MNPSVLCQFRQRLGEKSIVIIETEVFELLRQSGIVKGDTLMMDFTALSSNIIYPNDVMLIHKAFGKMEIFARNHEFSLWWDQSHIKKRWRAFGRANKRERVAYLTEFYTCFVPALDTFRTHVEALEAPESQKEKAQNLLKDQTQQKLTGEPHIDNLIVSLDGVDARPIKKGKTFPSCEFGTTLQMSFNRQGFMITTENLIGNPNDSTLYGNTPHLYEERMRGYPDTAVTDLTFRSQKNIKNTPESISHVFLDRSDDVEEAQQDFCRKARSATEGFIAVAKHLHGFGRSLYRGLHGDRVWTLLCQTVYNLRNSFSFIERRNWKKKL